MYDQNDNAPSSWNEYYQSKMRRSADGSDRNEMEPGEIDPLQGMRYDHIARLSNTDQDSV